MITKQELDTLKVGDVINVSDVLTIEQAMKRGEFNTVEGVHYQVDKIEEIVAEENITEWRFYHFVNSPQSLMVQITGNEIDIKLLEKPEWFTEGTVKEQVDDHDNCFLFEAPADPDNFEAADLELSEGFNLTFDDDLEVEYKPVGHSLFGEMEDNDGEPTFVEVKEYYALADSPSPRIVIVGLGGANHGAGAWIKYYEGYSVNHTDIEIFAQ